MQNNKKELYSLSNQMIELFIKDIFSKNEANIEKAKANISDEQRETLKQTVNRLQSQVESFIYDKDASKTTTEKNEKNTSDPISPLREKFSVTKETEDVDEEEKND